MSLEMGDDAAGKRNITKVWGIMPLLGRVLPATFDDSRFTIATTYTVDNAPHLNGSYATTNQILERSGMDSIC